MKRFLSMVLLCTLMVIQLVLPCNAIDNPQKIETAEKSRMILSNNNGTVYSMNVTEVSRKRSSKDDTESITLMATTDNMNLISHSPISTLSSMSDEYWDVTTSVHFYMTITYANGADSTILLTNISGNFVIEQSGITVSNQEVIVGCYAPFIYVAPKTFYPTKSSFNYNTGFTKYIPKTDYSTVGGCWKGTISRGSSWNFAFQLYRYGPY